MKLSYNFNNILSYIRVSVFQNWFQKWRLFEGTSFCFSIPIPQMALVWRCVITIHLEIIDIKYITRVSSWIWYHRQKVVVVNSSGANTLDASSEIAEVQLRWKIIGQFLIIFVPLCPQSTEHQRHTVMTAKFDMFSSTDLSDHKGSNSKWPPKSQEISWHFDS